MPRRRYVIVGNSAAGIAAAQQIRRHDSYGKITILSDEPTWGYSGILTTYLLAGLVELRQMFAWGPEFYRDWQIDLRRGVRVEGISPTEGRLWLNSGEVIPYDRLLVATGARPRQLGLEESDCPGVFTLRTLSDACQILQAARRARRAIVIGGGLVGMKVTDAFVRMGLPVRVLVSSDHVLSQMLDQSAALLVEQSLQQHGVSVWTGCAPSRILPGSQGDLRVETQGGDQFQADLIVVGKGVVPRVELVAGTGIQVEQGIVVDDRMRAGLPDVYAAGDVAQAPALLGRGCTLNAIWPAAVWQGRVTGCNMADNDAHYSGNLRMNVVSVCGAVGAILVSPRDVADVGRFHYLIRQSDRVSPADLRRLLEAGFSLLDLRLPQPILPKY